MIESDQVVEEGGLALVGEFGSMREANEYALVILAMNLDCWMRMEAGGQHFAIYAEPAFAVAIREEFELYTEEQSTPKDRKPEVPLYHSGMEFFPPLGHRLGVRLHEPDGVDRRSLLQLKHPSFLNRGSGGGPSLRSFFTEIFPISWATY